MDPSSIRPPATPMASDSHHRRIIQIHSLHDRRSDHDSQPPTAAERVAIMWQLTRDAWAFQGTPIDESRLQRHLVRVLRRAG